MVTSVLIGLALFQTPQDQNSHINELLDKGETVTLGAQGLKLSKFDFKFEDRNVEAVLFKPADEKKHPGLMLIPGYGRTARDYIPLGTRMAGAGFTCISVSQVGFGKSEGKSDFVGPLTIRSLEAAFDRFKKLPGVDAEKLGIFGYSRGAIAASILVTRLPEVKAAVFGGGIYDFKRAFDEVTIEGIKENMRSEAGMTPEAMKERSSIFAMEKLSCPVIILHGEKDENAPVSQARLLESRLKELGKDFEIVIFPGADHGLPMSEVFQKSVEFFRKKLMG